MSLKIQILCDNPGSWIVPYAEKLCNELCQQGNEAILLLKHELVTEGDILVLLSCERKFIHLNLNKHNLVVHESDLPKGKGWSPLTWQIIEGANRIPVTLFEATKEIDSGVIYDQQWIELKGTELVDELRHKQAEATMQLVLRFIEKHPNNIGRDQTGNSSFYPRRGPSDSMIDLDKSIREQFNLLRVCDNVKYPAWFEYKGQTYEIHIHKKE